MHQNADPLWWQSCVACFILSCPIVKNTSKDASLTTIFFDNTLERLAVCLQTNQTMNTSITS